MRVYPLDGLLIAQRGCLRNQARSFRHAERHAFTAFVQKPKFAQCDGVVLFGRQLQPIESLVYVLFDAVAIDEHHAQLHLRVIVAAIRGLLKPIRGGGNVFFDALAPHIGHAHFVASAY